MCFLVVIFKIQISNNYNSVEIIVNYLHYGERKSIIGKGKILKSYTPSVSKKNSYFNHE